MTRPPPRLTLFPYTTLFRSSASTPNQPVSQALNTTVNIINTVTTTVTSPAFVTTVKPVPPTAAPTDGASTAGGNTASAGGADRKSTRLNSSHTVISYAVFCL